MFVLRELQLSPLLSAWPMDISAFGHCRPLNRALGGLCLWGGDNDHDTSSKEDG